jgi:hypothetical protein
VDTQQFWELIEAARHQVPDSTNGRAAAAQAATVLSARPPDEILAADEVL